MKYVLLLVFVGLASTLADVRSSAGQQRPGHVRVGPEHIAGERMVLDDRWLYHPGDDRDWADPSYPDAAWEVTNSNIFPENLPASGWTGIGWFRIHLHPDTSLENVPFGLQMWQIGSTDVFLDGKRIFHFAPEDSTDPGVAHVHLTEILLLPLKAGKEHVLAVRHANPASPLLKRASYRMGFSADVGDMQAMFASHTKKIRWEAGLQMFFMGALLVLCLLHFLLFVFNWSAREHLYYTLFTASIAVVTYFIYQMSPVVKYGDVLDLLHEWNIATVVAPLLGIRLVYVLFGMSASRYFYAFTAAGLGLILWSIFDPVLATRVVNFYTLAGLLEFTRATAVGIRKNRSAWIIGVGALLLMVGAVQGLIVRMDFVEPSWNVNELYLMGIGALLFSMSAHLARNVARTNRDLRKQLDQVRRLSTQMTEEVVQRRLLEAEHVRKTRELEEARTLQLAMVPTDVPDVPDLDIAVYMRAATEVGGDYYDFHLAENGTLTVAVGDATGHGAKAGAMVTAAKSLFTALAHVPNLVLLLHRFSEALRSMHLPQIYLALLLLRIKDGKVRFASAGMPPVLVYRAATRTVEEIVVKGMPLGGPMRFPYIERVFTLDPGDTLLLMSDGLPELFSAEGEMLGYEGARALFQETARHAPEDIIRHLMRAGHSWSNGAAQTDDITFVVLHKKHVQERPVRVGEPPIYAEA